MALLELLLIKTPITDADYIRSLACKALVGLARSEPAKQVRHVYVRMHMSTLIFLDV